MTWRRTLLFVLLGVFLWGLYAVSGAVLDVLWRAAVSPREHQTVRIDEAHGPPDPRDWETLVDLRGSWDFRIGDSTAWADTADTDGWSDMFVPAAWEDEGYFGYDGYAWYRTAFTLGPDAAARARDEPTFLLLGRIDDADEAWLNGVYLGRGGRMPPLYKTASFGFRVYPVPPDLLRLDGPNTLAVRVYDDGQEGGILEGPVSLAVPTARNPSSVRLAVNLAGTWRFRPGDDARWATPDFDDTAWDSLRVPAVWDAQGYDFDGTAWYRKTVTLTAKQAEQDLVLILGAVDDLDQTFINGQEVGATGDVDAQRIDGDEWLAERAYPVPAGTLRAGENVVAVRVYDALFDGGIHLGPVGLMTPEAHARRAAAAQNDTR